MHEREGGKLVSDVATTMAVGGGASVMLLWKGLYIHVQYSCMVMYTTYAYLS